MSLYFYPDADGSIGSFKYNNEQYYYVRNAQNDVIGITDKNGNFVAKYTYDEWGKILTITDGNGVDVSMYETHIANLNPFRYRSYFYDAETGFYWLNTRYYDPAIGRFINADSVWCIGSNTDLASYNIFSYCGNNPTNRKDLDGYLWDTIFDVVSLCFSVADVVQNPTDPMAWVGLAADVASLVVPCVTGGGSLVKAATKADDVAVAVTATGKIENSIDFAHTASFVKNSTAPNAIEIIDDATPAIKKGWHVGDDITNLTSAGNTPSWSTVRQRYWKNQAYFNGDLYPNDLDRLKKGLAPIGCDGFSMELHHPYGRSGDNFYIFEPLTRTEHRYIHYGK